MKLETNKIYLILSKRNTTMVFLFLCLLYSITQSNYSFSKPLSKSTKYQNEHLISKVITQQSFLDTLFTIDDIELEEDSEFEINKKLFKTDKLTSSISNHYKSKQNYYFTKFKYNKQKIRIYIINQVFRN